MAWSNEKKLEMFPSMLERECKQRGAIVHTIYNLGCALVCIDDNPGETEQEILETIKLLTKVLTD
jgi:hypothetical protein